MKVIIPEHRDSFNEVIYSANLVRYADWAVGTSYNVGDVVRRNGYEFEALTTTTGLDPDTDLENTTWMRLGVYNQFKPFNNIISDPAKATGDIIYTIDPSRLFTSIAVLSVVAESVQVDILAPDNTPIHTETKSLINSPNVLNWFDYFFLPLEFSTELIFTNLPGYTGNKARITFRSDGACQVGQIVIGTEFEIGTLNEDTSIGIQDFSRKERDEFGRPRLVERAYAQRAEYDIAIPTMAARQVQRKLASIRATPAVYYGGIDDDKLGTMIFGFFNDFSINLKVGSTSFMTLTVEGLV